MKHYLPILFFIICFISAKAQTNLVPNPSFEIHDTCPNGPSQLSYAIPWESPTTGTPDYLNNCDTTNTVSVPKNFWGFQYAKSGVAYAGFFACFTYPDSTSSYNYREYIEVKLDSPLIANKKYYVNFYVSLADSMNYATDNIGLYFSQTYISRSDFHAFGFTPQIANTLGNILTDKVNWMKISGQYIAIGGEQYVTIGNFKNDINTDTVHVSGGSANLGQSDWYGGYYYIDNICITLDSLGCVFTMGIPEIQKNKTINVYPNPVATILNIDNNTGIISNYVIVNLKGITVSKGNLNNGINQIDIAMLDNGFYILEISNSMFYKISINH
jgi:hypothetical protein